MAQINKKSGKNETVWANIIPNSPLSTLISTIQWRKSHRDLNVLFQWLQVHLILFVVDPENIFFFESCKKLLRGRLSISLQSKTFYDQFQQAQSRSVCFFLLCCYLINLYFNKKAWKKPLRGWLSISLQFKTFYGQNGQFQSSTK